jgi:hypothetical protein
VVWRFGVHLAGLWSSWGSLLTSSPATDPLPPLLTASRSVSLRDGWLFVLASLPQRSSVELSAGRTVPRRSAAVPVCETRSFPDAKSEPKP